MGVFCDRLKFGSTAALDYRTGPNKSIYCKKELLLPLVFAGQKGYFLLDCSKPEVKNVIKINSSRLLGMYWIILPRRTYWTQPVQKDGAQWI